MRSREEWSAQWTSSTTTREGCASPSAVSRAWTASATWPGSVAASRDARRAAASGASTRPGQQVAEARVRHEHALDDVGVASVDGADELDEGEVGEAAAGLADAVADGREPAGARRRRRELRDEPRLADAGVARQHDDATGPGTRVGRSPMASARRDRSVSLPMSGPVRSGIRGIIAYSADSGGSVGDTARVAVVTGCGPGGSPLGRSAPRCGA